MRSKLVVGGATVAVAVLLATQPVVVEAARLVTSAQIKNNTIKSKDVKDGALIGADIGDNSLTGADIGDNSLTGADVGDNSLTGADIQEGTLSGVNASTLNGLPAASYQNTTYTFTLPVTAASVSKIYTAGVPAGTYLVSYNVIALGSDPRCRLFARTDVMTTAFGWSDAFQGSGGTAFFGSSTAVLTVPAGQTPALVCSGGAAFQLYPGGDGTSSMSFTRLDTVIPGAATGGREGPSGRPGSLG
jgi:hypothetical protein